MNESQESTLNIPKTPLRFIWYITKTHKKWAFFAILGATVGQLLMSFTPFVLKQIVDAFTTPTAFEDQVAIFSYWGVVYVGLFLVGFIGWRVSGFVGMGWLTRANATGYQKLYTYISGHSHTYFTNRFAGALSNKVSNASDGSERLLERSLWGWYPEFIALAVGVVLLFSVDSHIAIGFIGVFIFVCWVNWVWVRHRRPHVVAYAAASSKLRGEGVDYLTNVTAARQYARSRHELLRIGGAIEERRVKDVRQWRMSEFAMTFNNLAVVALVGGILLYIFILFKNGAATAGEVVLVLAVLQRIVHVINFIGNAMNAFMRVYGEIEEGLEAVIMPHEIVDIEGAQPLNVQEGKVEWSDVQFDFGDNQVFKDFNLTIAPGSRVGLVGASGAGKTTFVSLLLRQHEVDGGSISIDGQNIAEVTQDSLRENIAVVPQEPLLFHRSIRENIAYGKLDATDEEIEDVAKKAEAHEFVSSLPDGYETLVGERGVKLSGGQRQRIAIARAMLKDAPILVLDEATSALDSESEVAIQKALHELMEGKTVVAIAHRLSTLREMDRIIVMEAGKIVEDGTHEELTKSGGVYANLWEHQAGGFLQE